MFPSRRVQRGQTEQVHTRGRIELGGKIDIASRLGVTRAMEPNRERWQMPAWQSPSSCAPRAAMMRSARSVVVAVLMVVCLSEPNFIPEAGETVSHGPAIASCRRVYRQAFPLRLGCLAYTARSMRKLTLRMANLAAATDPTMPSSNRSHDPDTGCSTPSKTRPKAERRQPRRKPSKSASRKWPAAAP